MIKIDKKPYKNIDIYNSVNPLYLIIGKADEYIQENNGNKYLLFTSTDGNKKKLAKFTKLLNKVTHIIETKNEVRRVSIKKIS